MTSKKYNQITRRENFTRIVSIGYPLDLLLFVSNHFFLDAITPASADLAEFFSPRYFSQ